MSSVTFSTAIGGDGSTVTDDDNASTGLRNGGWRTRFIPCFTQQVAIAETLTNRVLTLSDTSASSVTIGTGSKSFTTAKFYTFAVGQFVVVASSASPSNYMYGQVTAYNSSTGALTVNVTVTSGSGTISSWAISCAMPSLIGQLAGLRNRILNGSGRIQQRNSPTLTSSVQYGPDRWLGSISGGSSISGTFRNATMDGTTSGYGIYCYATTFTTGQPYFAQRIEQRNIADLKSQSVTVSGKLYQDTGSSQNFVVRLSKPSTVDDFSATSVIATSSNIAIPSSGTTSFSANFTLGSTDAGTGLLVEIYLASAISATSKNFAIADIQLEAGTIATPFEIRNYGHELELCKRYYYVPNISHAVGAGVGGSITFAGSHPVSMRATPTPVSPTGTSITYNQNGYQVAISAGGTCNVAGLDAEL